MLSQLSYEGAGGCHDGYNLVGIGYILTRVVLRLVLVS
jgi:hypothetical protein